ncbi:MAG: hypothetical protein P0Y51_25565 [Candidatus Pseudomonas colombiensis]|jgi:hypothetical protein|uniref:DUF2868 domain-containing protein n=1 Tax=Pseudomonas morbosilactucae TaxID=2938197 RepID=A0ABT0JDD5_9PSED|nr:hypothetical protein [Pseudomonas morbosilactucae]MCK9813875.1 hypothetical protein [Pseudomonas morbosilactucae]WEK08480.1 MAG: hypothetical protein P0Y51_25565 [Pseudomonas sp.]
MNDKNIYAGSHPVNRLENQAWLANHSAQQLDRHPAPERRQRAARHRQLLKRLAWLGASTTVMLALVTWGFHSRFGLLLLLLLR